MGHFSRGHRPAAPTSPLRLAATASLVVVLFLASTGVGMATDTDVDPQVVGRIAAEDIMLRSQAGLTLIPPSELLVAIAGDEDAAAWALPEDTALLEAVYDSASNASTWTEASYDTTITPAGQAGITLAGLRLAALMTESEGPEEARARLYAIAAKAAADYALVNLVDAEGQVGALSEEGLTPAPIGDSWLLLLALSELAVITSPDGDPEFQDELFYSWFAGGATSIHQVIRADPPSSNSEISIATRALAAYTYIAEDPAAITDEIIALTGAMPAPDTVMDEAWALRSLVAAHTATGDQAFLSAAESAFHGLVSDLDLSNGAISSTDSLTIWQLGDLVGSLADAATLPNLTEEATAAVESMVHHLFLDSGLMPAVPTSDNRFFPTVTTPAPPADDMRWAFASAIHYDTATGVWTVGDDISKVDIPGALYASSELLALTPPTPHVSTVATANAATTGPRELVVTSTEFGFSPSSLTLVEGEEVVLKLVNTGAVEHNIDIPTLGVLLTAAPGDTAETTFVVPDANASGDFTCNLPGHAEAGMVGAVEIKLAATTSGPAPTADSGNQTVTADIQLDEAGGSPSITTAIILAVGFFLGMMALVVGMLQFMKGFEEQR